MNDETKLNCAGEFMTACENLTQMDQAIRVLAVLIDDGVDSEFLSGLAGALEFATAQVAGDEEFQNKEYVSREFVSDATTSVLEFCHTYLVKAYEKKVGRA